MKSANRLLPLLTLIAVFAVSAAAQTGSIRGTVIGPDGEPLAGATILIDRQDIAQHFETTSDDNGGFFHAGLPPYLYRITLVVDGRELTAIEGKVNLGAPTPVNFNLKMIAEAVAETPEAKAAAEARARVEAARGAFDIGVVEMANKNYDEAIRQFQLALESDDTQHIVYANLADAQSAARQYDGAITNYRNALALSPGEGGYLINLGTVYASAGQIDQAIETLEEAYTMDPSSGGQIYYNLGAVLSNQGRAADAAAAFNKAIEVDPEYAEAYFQLGLSYLGDPNTIPDAVPALEKYIELEPDGPNAEAAKQLIAFAKGGE